MEKTALLVIRLRYWVVAFFCCVTLVLGYFLKDLRVNADVLGYLPDDDPAAVLFQHIGQQYGGNEIIIIGMNDLEVFNYESLRLIKAVTDSVRSVPGIGFVTSITNVLDIRSDEYGIVIGRLVDEFNIPNDPATLQALKEYTLSKEMYRGNLVSADGRATLVIGKILDEASSTDVVEQIQAKLKTIPYDGEFYYAGMPLTLLELSRVIQHDIRFITPVAFILICLALFAGFRSARGIVIPMLSVLIAVVWTMGIMGLLGISVTLITNLLPVILLAVGSAYAIHVVNRINEEMRINPKGAIVRAMIYVSIPVIMASITTMVGFLSFIAGSYLTMIQEFGLFTALGILFSLLIAIFFVPALQAIMGDFETKKSHVNNPFISAITGFINTLIFGYKRWLFFAWSLLLIYSIFGFFRIERRVDLVDYFKEDNPVKRGEYLLKNKFHGSVPLYVLISGDVQDPDVLDMMSKTQEFMESFPYIPHSQSVADLVKQMNEIMGEGRVIPDDRAKISQLWFLLDGQEVMEQLVNFDRTEGVIQGSVASTDLEVLREIEHNFSEFVAQHNTEKYTLQVTGIPIMFRRLDDSIIRSQISSLIIAILLVVVVVSFLRRSLLQGLLAVVPVAATLIILFGTMGNAGIPLDIATVLTGSITIGIGIDYAIHFMAYFGNAYQRNSNISESIRETVNGSGRAIIINIFAVTLGFAVLLFSNLVPMQRFGLLIAVTMVSSGLAAMTLLPLLLLSVGSGLENIFKLKSQISQRLKNNSHNNHTTRNQSQ